MTKNFTLSIILSFLIIVSYAQENYKEATIINLKGDTIKGFIDYKNWENNPKHIKFKESLSSVNKIFGTDDILLFEVANEKYLSALVDVSYSPLDINRIKSNSSKPDLKKESVFLQMITEGKKSLYYFTSLNSEGNFYIKNDNKYELLIYKKYIHSESSNILENTTFRNQLYAYLEYPLALQSKIESAQYTQNDIQHIFEAYYHTKKSIGYKSIKDPIKSDFGLTLGGIHRNFHIENLSPFAYKTTPAFGVFFNLIIPRNLEKINFYSDLLYVYSKFRENRDFHETGFSTATIVEKYNLDISSLKLSNSLRYLFYKKDNFGIFLQAGITNSFLVSVKNEKITYTERSGNTTEDKLNAITNLRKYEQGYALGTGLKKDKYALDFRFEKTNGISSGLNSKLTSFYILASYAF